MGQRRVRVAVVYGGRSGEHEVSLESARSVIRAIDRRKYAVIPIGITPEGAWLAAPPEALRAGRLQAGHRVLPSADPGRPGLIPFGEGGDPDPTPRSGRARELSAPVDGVDVVFPLIHGTFGEDGCLQGLFELANVPYVGAGVLGSAVGMDKIMMKTVFRAQGFPVVDFLSILRADWERDPSRCLARIEEEIGIPSFVKPSNLGSSVGITKAHSREELSEALALAAEFGSRILVERAVDAREIECGVLGNDEPSASVVGEVIPAREFYDYEAKYHDPSTRFVIPAEIEPAISDQVRDLAMRAFKAVGAAGMARVDFFLGRVDGALYLNEINTIPGFTAMSVYPRLWMASGVPYPKLIDRLIQLAIERHRDQSRNRTQYEP